MKSKIIMILSVCVVQHVYASSLDYGTRFDLSVRGAVRAVSSSVSDAFKHHPYLLGSAAVLGTTVIMCKVLQSKKEVIQDRSSVSPEALSPFSDSEQTYLTPGISKLAVCSQEGLSHLEEEVQGLEDKGKRMEKIRVVRQVLKQESSPIEGGYKAVLVKHKTNGENSVLLKGADGSGYRYPFILSDDNEGTLFCQMLNEYFDPSKKISAEKNLRDLIGLRDEQPWDEATLKSLLNGIRSTIKPLSQE